MVVSITVRLLQFTDLCLPHLLLLLLFSFLIFLFFFIPITHRNITISGLPSMYCNISAHIAFPYIRITPEERVTAIDLPLSYIVGRSSNYIASDTQSIVEYAFDQCFGPL